MNRYWEPWFALLVVGLVACSDDSPTEPAELPDSLIAYYPLDGTTDDATGNGHHGTLRDSTIVKPGTGTINNSATPLEIGRAESGGSPERYFGGEIDDVAIYARSLTAAEVLTLFQDGV